MLPHGPGGPCLGPAKKSVATARRNPLAAKKSVATARRNPVARRAVATLFHAPLRAGGMAFLCRNVGGHDLCRNSLSVSQPRSLQRSGHQQADGRPALSPDWPCTAGAADPTHIYPYRSVSCSAVAPLQRRGSIAAMELRHLNLDRFEEVPFYPCAKWGVVSRLFIQNGAKRLKNGAFQGYTVSLIDRTGIFGNDVGDRT